nr:oligosaccharide flippase family protein [Pseudomonas fragi]
MALGAGSIFLSILILKRYLSPEDYGRYSGLITLTMIISAIGLLSYEQATLRLASISENKILILPSNTVLTAMLIAASTSATSSYFYTHYFDDKSSPWKIFIICFSLSMALFASSINRLRSNFTSSQIILHSWKIIFLAVIATILITKGNVTYESIETILLLACILGLSSAVFSTRNRIGYSALRINTIPLTASFLASTAIIVAINNSDKFAVGKIIGKEELGNYFFTATIYTYPFLIISSFIGLTQLVAFKSKFNISILNKQIRQVLTLTPLILAVYYGITAYAFSLISPGEKQDHILIAVFLAISTTRIVYAVISSAMGATGSTKTILTANLYFFILSIPFTLLLLQFPTNTHTVAIIVFGLLVIRSLFYFTSLVKQEHEKTINTPKLRS